MFVLIVDDPTSPIAEGLGALADASLTTKQVATLDGLLATLRTSRFDAVIAASTRSVDALTALTICKLKQPWAARVAVRPDDDADRDLETLVEAAHRTVPPSLSPPRIRGILSLITSHGRTLPEPLVETVGAIASVPSVRDAVDELRGAIADHRRGVEDVVGVIRRDPALATKVLHLANAGFARRNMPVHDLKQAAALLGLSALQRLAIASVAFSSAEEMGADARAVDAAQRHGVAAARAIERVPGLPAEASTGALLIDIGLPLMSLTWPDEHAETRQLCIQSGTALVRAEQSRFAVSHADAGALLARRWSLPELYVSMIGSHHFASAGHDCSDRDLGYLAHMLAQRGPGEGRDPFESVDALAVPPWIEQFLVRESS